MQGFMKHAKCGTTLLYPSHHCKAWLSLEFKIGTSHSWVCGTQMEETEFHRNERVVTEK